MSDEQEPNALASDAPDAPEADVPEAAEAEVEAGSPEEAEQPGEAPPEAKAEEADEDDDGERERKKRRNRHPAEERIKQLVEERKALERRLQRYEAAATKPAPKIEEFNTIEEYEDARDEWRHARRAKAEAEAEIQDRDGAAEEIQKQVAQERLADFARRADSFARRAGLADYAERVYDPALPLPAHVAEMVAELEEGPAVLYRLAEDHSLARRIAQLSPRSAALELGRLAASAAAPVRKIASKAPPPISPVTGGGGGNNFNPETASYAEYRQWRMQQMEG